MSRKTLKNWSVRDSVGVHGFFSKYIECEDYIDTTNRANNGRCFLEIWHLEDEGRHLPYHPEDYHSDETPPHIAESKGKKMRKAPELPPVMRWSAPN